MALTPLASVQDLSDWLGEPIMVDTPDSTRAGSVLAAASVLVRNFTAKSWLVDGVIDPALPDDVLMVAVQVAARGYVNPEGWANEGIDDWRGGGRKVDEAGLFLTASEKAILAGHRAVKVSGIGVLGTTRWPTPTTNTWVPTNGGPDFPWY